MIEENRDAAYRAYWVECAKEMGWQDNGYKYYSDLLEGTSFNPDDALPIPERPRLLSRNNETGSDELRTDIHLLKDAKVPGTYVS